MKTLLFKREQFLACFFLFAGLLSTASMHAADVTLTGTGTLGASPTGDWSITPESGDNIILAAGAQLTVNGNFTVGTLTFTGGGSSSTLTISDGVTLTAAGLITITVPTTNDITNLLDVGDGTLIAGAGITLTQTNYYPLRKSILRINDGLVQTSGRIIMGGDTDGKTQIDFTGAGTLETSYLSGTTAPITGGVIYFIDNPSIVATVKLTGAAGQLLPAGYTYPNVVIAGTGAKKPNSATAWPLIKGTLTLNQDIDITGSNLAYANLVEAGGELTYTGTNAGLGFCGATAQTIPTTHTTLARLYVDNPAGITLGHAVSGVAGIWLMQGTLTGSTNITTTSSRHFYMGGGSFDINYCDNKGLAFSDVSYTYTGGSTVTLGAGNEIPAGTTTLNKLFAIDSGTTAVLPNDITTVNISGSLSYSGTLNPGNATFTIAGNHTSTLTFDDDGSKSTFIFEKDANIRGNFENLIINAPVNLWYQSGASPFTVSVSGTLTLNNVLTLNNNNLTLAKGAVVTSEVGFGADAMINTNSSGVFTVSGNNNTPDDFYRVYPVGSNGVYAPLDLTAGTIGAVGTNPTLTIRTYSGVNPLHTSQENALSRSWNLYTSNFGTATIDGTFVYGAGELKGSGDFKLGFMNARGGTHPLAWSEIASTVDDTNKKIDFTGLVPVNNGNGTQYTAAAALAAPWTDNPDAIYTNNTSAWTAANKWRDASGAIIPAGMPATGKDVYILHHGAVGGTAVVNNLYLFGLEGNNSLQIAANHSLTVEENAVLSGRFGTNASSIVHIKGDLILNEGNLVAANSAVDGFIVEGNIENNGGMFSITYLTIKGTGAKTLKGKSSTVGTLNIASGNEFVNEAERLTISTNLLGDGKITNKGWITYSSNTRFTIADYDFTMTPNTFEYNYGADQAIKSGNFYDLIINSGSSAYGRTKTLDAGTDLNVSNDLYLQYINAITTLSTNGNNVIVGGNLILDNGVNFTPTGSAGIKILTVGGTIINEGNLNLNSGEKLNLVLSKESGVVISGNSGFTAPSITFTGNGDKEIDCEGEIVIADGAFNNQSGTLEATVGTIRFGGSARTATVNGTGITFNNLTVGTGNTAATLETDVTVNGDLVFNVNANNSNVLNLNGKQLNLNGDLTGTNVLFAGNGGALIINGTGALSTPLRFATGAESSNLTINRGGETVIEISSSSSNVTLNALTLTQGMLETNDKLVYAENATLTYNGTLAQTIGKEWSDALYPANVVINNPAGVSGNVATYTGDLSLDGGIFKLASGKVLQLDNPPTVANNGKIQLADATSELQIKASAASLLFPVGSSTAYSPVTATVSTPDNAYIGVKISEAVGIGNEDGLKRVWEVSGTTPNPSFSFTYLDSDLSEEDEENILYTGYYDASSVDWKRITSQKADEENNTLSSGTEYGYGKYSGIYDNKAKITLPADIEGIVFNKTPGVYEVKEGGNFTFMVFIEDQYSDPSSVITVEVNGAEIFSGENGLYTISDVEKNGTYVIDVDVTGLVKKKLQVVMPESPAGATIDKEAGDYEVEYGDSFTFSITLDPEYDQSVVVVKANDVPITQNNEGNFVIENIDENTAITIEGVTKNTYIVNIPIVTGATIHYEGSNEVIHGENFSFTVTAEDGYDISGITVKVGEETLTAEAGVYTIENITSNVTLSIDGITTGLNAKKILDAVWTGERKLFVSATESGQLYIYNLQGAAQSMHLIHEGINEINLLSGFYIIVINNESHKLIVK